MSEITWTLHREKLRLEHRCCQGVEGGLSLHHVLVGLLAAAGQQEQGRRYRTRPPGPTGTGRAGGKGGGLGLGALVRCLTARPADDLPALGQVGDGGWDHGHQHVPLAGGQQLVVAVPDSIALHPLHQ